MKKFACPTSKQEFCSTQPNVLLCVTRGRSVETANEWTLFLKYDSDCVYVKYEGCDSPAVQRWQFHDFTNAQCNGDLMPLPFLNTRNVTRWISSVNMREAQTLLAVTVSIRSATRWHIECIERDKKRAIVGAYRRKEAATTRVSEKFSRKTLAKNSHENFSRRILAKILSRVFGWSRSRGRRWSWMKELPIRRESRFHDCFEETTKRSRSYGAEVTRLRDKATAQLMNKTCRSPVGYVFQENPAENPETVSQEREKNIYDAITAAYKYFMLSFPSTRALVPHTGGEFTWSFQLARTFAVHFSRECNLSTYRRPRDKSVLADFPLFPPLRARKRTVEFFKPPRLVFCTRTNK